jgi:hypothetical protein
MTSGSGAPEQEWRSYVDDEDGEDYLAPAPFTVPLPSPTEKDAQ